MIGPAEMEDMRLDLMNAEQAALYDAAIAPLSRHWSRRGAPSVGTVSRVCALVFEQASGRRVTDWKAVLIEALSRGGYYVEWQKDDVTAFRGPAE
ncbi:hypothetical protein [Methylobacterium oxalidis]|uniref:Uncharacterized protein n=1 Tax=Methylobacterium oxalidis TaxID=944322 RepID=A0A512JDN2_9HYPH|nr:hypothetical protein [Methylobacterium oxalidis]GEP08064.1 hypothetical protein MOX02_61020 [Methylobacterium oxalidis]GJE35771.1 hypothetical protein LDDCCGHA_5991 [Methylobacterium oxalidis]GLS62498.1 hypothetical protein GCM10007888_08790 [Methylobacterium oxalidis]